MLDNRVVHNRRKYDGLSVEQKVDEALSLLEAIMEAFPEGPAKHREVHEVWMQAKREEVAFWREMKLDIAKKGAWGLLIMILGLIAVGLSSKTGVWFR